MKRHGDSSLTRPVRSYLLQGSITRRSTLVGRILKLIIAIWVILYCLENPYYSVSTSENAVHFRLKATPIPASEPRKEDGHAD